MSEQIPIEAFRSGLLTVLEEVFEQVHGYVLDPGTSLFETLAMVSAAEASRPVFPGAGNLAAQVNHTRVYLDAFVTGLATGGAERPDWPGSWRVGPVDEEAWADLIAGLQAAYEQIRAFAGSFEGWDARFIGGAFALVAHSAYHLGEIRQGLGVLRASGPVEAARAGT